MKLFVFSSKSCGPCKIMAPIIASVTTELGVEVEKFMAASSADIFRRLDVTSVPTLITFDELGMELRRHTGLMSKPKLREFLGG